MSEASSHLLPPYQVSFDTILNPATGIATEHGPPIADSGTAKALLRASHLGI